MDEKRKTRRKAHRMMTTGQRIEYLWGGRGGAGREGGRRDQAPAIKPAVRWVQAAGERP